MKTGSQDSQSPQSCCNQSSISVMHLEPHSTTNHISRRHRTEESRYPLLDLQPLKADPLLLLQVVTFVTHDRSNSESKRNLTFRYFWIWIVTVLCKRQILCHVLPDYFDTSKNIGIINFIPNHRNCNRATKLTHI